MGGYGIVGGNLPLAAGMALSSDYRGTEEVTRLRVRRRRLQPGHVRRDAEPRRAVEAARRLHGHQQPVRHGHLARAPLRGHRPARRGEGFGVPGMQLRRHGRARHLRGHRRGAQQAREERQPVLVEAITYRFRGHSMADPEEYRTKEQVEEWRKRDPIQVFGASASRRRACSRRARRRSSTRRSSSAIDEAVAFADKAALPAARVALRRRLRARRPGEGWYSVDERSAGVHRGEHERELAEQPSAGPRRRTTTAVEQPRARGRRRREGRRRGAGRGRRRRAQPRTTVMARHALPRGAQPGAARGDAARRERLPHGRGHRRLQRRLQGHRRACSRSSARSACATRRSPRTRSSAWASARR